MPSRLELALADRYRIERELGAGGMATVYLAQDVRHDRKVAVKVLRPELAAAIGAERFLAEIKTTANLQHPHILPLFDSGETESFLYYVMPWVTGESLRDRLTREGQLPLEEVLKITGELAEAVDYAHSQGVVHRDIKPENILFQAGHASICDFGIARAISEAGGVQLTGSGIAVGTPAYMSPEQATGAAVDNRTDIYALGCVVYEMLAGEPPYTGPTAMAILSRRLTEPVPPLSRTRQGMPESVDAALHQAMARSPADRFRTAAQFTAALGVVAAPARSRVERRPRWMLPAVIGLVLTFALAWGILRPRTGASVPLSESRLAVFPFAVRAADTHAYLGEGIVDLLSRDLDGVEGLRTVDPGTILSAVGESGSGPLDAERVRSVARRVGAGLYVTGSVHAAGSQLRIQAQLHDGTKGTPGEPVAQASVDGDGGDVFTLMDQLASRLIVATTPRGAVRRLVETAARTTTSLPALKEYLSAEAALRAGNKDTAIAGFRRAVDQDSTFALAYYRLAVAAGWHDRQQDLASWATARALAVSDRMVERDRRLLSAYAGFRRGAADSAEALYRGLLRDYPDDLEAQFQLADLLYQYNPLRGRPRSEARELFDAVLAYDPGFL